MAEVSIVLVHGAFHSFRCWSDLIPILEGAGVECRAVDLPNTSMADDVAATRRCLDTVGTPVVLLAMRPTGEDGPLYVDSEAAKDVFYNHCPAPAATAAASQVRPIMPACLAEAIGEAAWRSRPSSYIYTQDDNALLLAAQEVFAAKLACPTQAIWGDHSPFLSHPQELADLLVPLLK